MARKRGLTQDEVVATAEAVADTAGLEGVTLAQVARRLGVRSPSLYSHVEGLDGLLRRLALRGAREVALSLTDAAWGRTGEDALRAIATEYRSFARCRPGLYAAVQRAVTAGDDPELYEALGRVVTPLYEALGRAGVPSEDRVHVARAFRSALHGFVTLEAGSGFGRPESVDESFERLVELLVAGVIGFRGRPGESAHSAQREGVR